MNASEAATATTNLTLKAFIESQLGVQTLPLPVVVPLTVLFVLISITGVVGNGMVCMVIARHFSMHTATNYYLFSLALSDITILVFGEYHQHLFLFLFGSLLHSRNYATSTLGLC
jgi:neuromedin U receptor 1